MHERGVDGRAAVDRDGDFVDEDGARLNADFDDLRDNGAEAGVNRDAPADSRRRRSRPARLVADEPRRDRSCVSRSNSAIALLLSKACRALSQVGC